MPLVINATEETIAVKLCGNWFTFKPGQSKKMNDDLAKFIAADRRDSGLAVVPELYADNEDVDAELDSERKSAHEEAKRIACDAALDEYIRKLRKVIENNQISLRRDLEQKNIKADPAAYISEGELQAMRTVAKYQKRGEDVEKARIEEVKKLMEATARK